MNILKSLRRVFFRVAANDNKKLHSPDLSEENLNRALNPPNDSTQENLHGVTVKDPFRPLEKLDAAETTAWMARENKRFEDFVSSAKSAKDDVLEFFDKTRSNGMSESMPGKHGDRYFVWRTKPGAVRNSYYTKDTPDYGAPARLLIDPKKIDPSGRTNIVAVHVAPDGKTLAYRVSTSGSDKETLRFMDVATGRNFGPVYTSFRSSVIWDRDGKGFHYTQNDPVTKTSEVRYHKMDTPPAEDKVVYSPGVLETGSHYFRLTKDSKVSGDYEWITVTNNQPARNALLARPVGSNEPFREIFPHKEGSLSSIAEIGGRIYACTGYGTPNIKLVSFDINDPAPEKWQTIIPENKEDELTHAFVWRNKIFATYRHDTGQVLKVFDLTGKHLHDAPIPPLSTFAIGQVRQEDPECLITYNNFQEDGNIYKYNADTNTLTLHKKSTMPIGLKDCIVERIHATSKDGTKVPMTVIRHPDTKLDGTAATLLYGYGGFGVSLEPKFSTSIAQWVRSGGIYVQANLRGGGEFGQKWYDAGRKEKKQNVFDDFAACAEHLIKEKYTTNKRLAIEGGSNGGLLTLATMIQRPELFGAVVSAVPVADMFRFHLGSYYGYGWKSDYGDPGIKEDFNNAARYSPLHNVKKDFKHPPLLIKTDKDDDRVLPWHSYKMAATLQTTEDQSSLTLLKVGNGGGHSAGMTWGQWCEDIASVRAFLVKTLGPIDQNAYKAKLVAEAQPRKKKGFLRRRFG